MKKTLWKGRPEEGDFINNYDFSPCAHSVLTHLTSTSARSTKAQVAKRSLVGRYVPRSPRWLIVTTTQFAASVACNSLEGIILLRERIAMRQFTCRINNALHVQHWAASCTGRQATVLMYNSHFEQSVSVTECYLLLIEQVRWDRAAAVAVTHSSNTIK